MIVHVGYIFKLKEKGVPRKMQLANLEGKRPISSIFKAPTLLGLVEFLHCTYDQPKWFELHNVVFGSLNSPTTCTSSSEVALVSEMIFFKNSGVRSTI